MASETKHSVIRLASLIFLFLGICLFYVVTLVRYQIAGQDYYTMSGTASLSTRTVTLYAQRGEIFDRNGVPLVTNDYTYSVLLDGGSMPRTNGEKNELLLYLTGEGSAFFTYPESPFFVAYGEEDIVFSYNRDFLSTTYGRRYTRLMNDITGGEEVSATEAAFRLMLRYGICREDYETLLYTPEKAVLLMTVRLDMETHNFSPSEPYTILKSVNLSFLSAMKELSLKGVAVKTEATRVYEFPGVASHILGRTGKIQSAYVDHYTALGYKLDAIVGVSGAEYAFEEELRGIDGEMVITEDAYGNIVDRYIKKEPVAGSDVYLTIDVEYQKVAEAALKDNIDYIVEKALEGGEPLTGEDADAGAVTMLDVKTGEILALATYPTYDLTTFNEDFDKLNADPTQPMLNRALYGQYPPGSTFKVGVATAALMENILYPDTLLECAGVYQYYAASGFTPACWIHSEQYGYRNHGYLNVTKAIQDSCNCFFYEVGRQLGITTMNRYCAAYGFGQGTGIELGESLGVLAGPDYRESTGGESWSPGDTCTAAIGQSDNLVTPLQLSVSVSTILNSGTRLKATILKEIRSYGGELLYETTPVVMDSIGVDPSVHNLVLSAMKDVTEQGSAARVFRDYEITVGGKTGTAQRLKSESAFATFTAFAPFEDPEIVVSCIIERGAAGTDAGFAVKDVFDVYFGLGDYAPQDPDGGTAQ